MQSVPTFNKIEEAEQMKLLMVILAVVGNLGFFTTSGYQLVNYNADLKYGEEIADLTDQLSQVEFYLAKAEQEKQHAAAVELLARAFYGEFRSNDPEKGIGLLQRQIEWLHMFSAIYNRMQHDWWPSELVETLLFECEINALCDKHPEDLTTDIGQEAVAFATQMVNALKAGQFQSSHRGHSWATPAALEGNAYFAGKCEVAEAAGHKFFSDCDLTYAPAVSLRAFARPLPETLEAVRVVTGTAFNF